MLPGTTGFVVKRPSASVTVSLVPVQIDTPRSALPVAESSTRPTTMRGSPRGSAGAGAGAGEAWTAGVSDGVGETVAGVPEVSAAGPSGSG